MSADLQVNEALEEAKKADAEVSKCLEAGKNVLLEAGAGAGKTYSLVEALRFLIASKGDQLRKKGQRIACITYTNVAAAVITERIDGNPVVFIDTIHAFLWSLIRSYQPMLRDGIQGIEAWKERLAESETPLGTQKVEYDLGYRSIKADVITLHHDDVLALAVGLLANSKFQGILAGKYPFILIDEYQDTNAGVMQALKENLFGRAGGPQFGLFGDHWQQIYDGTCGRVSSPALVEIPKRSNFRSAVSIVSVLNKMRPELPQGPHDSNFIGSAIAYHTNSWTGQRQTSAHWKGDLPAEIAEVYLEQFINKLKAEDGWDFSHLRTKVLMLTHNVLAKTQGYSDLAKVFDRTELFIKKENEHIAFFADKLEPACEAFTRRSYGEMFAPLGDRPLIRSQKDKAEWVEFMNKLLDLRAAGSVGDVIDFLRATSRIALPEGVIRAEELAKTWSGEPVEYANRVERTRNLREIPYKQVIALDDFIDGNTPFATKHSVKGDQFENVLVVLGRGWNKYNWAEYLEWAGSGVPDGKKDSYERNRNLFYVSCSRPTTRLALFFTQQLGTKALHTLTSWFGANCVRAFAAS
ncbi:UvrD-helicase domain-containing protein [Hyphomicrobium sp. DMF-1]|uniref:UvrD-helicase domain-containing protein n=1 Tax=Hyphomicrobium sp. DMF-1 TaxID=3019544 RepID=UPI0022EBC0CA|nr:UvrD-helicase domain-containing protein [Hyphomicrobium sp. DMF-1]WBT37795.1 AAA family ATPase [Hyphomicrobium sp. DMF-1]